MLRTLYGQPLSVVGYTDAPAEMEANGMTFPVAAMVEIFPGVEKPLLDIPQMSDFSWQLGALEGRLKDPHTYADRLGEDVGARITRLRQWLLAHIDQATAAERARFWEVGV